ncbi:MAG: peptide chain release factor 2 [Candidatus Uhrbacteria bacterium]|nr:peptide chain release factor 2 [Candidatus Uhrbacteria bacterium]
MSALEKQLQDLQNRVNNAWEVLSLDEVAHKIIGLEAEMNQPDFWQDQNMAKLTSKEASDYKTELNLWQQLRSDIDDATALAKVAEDESDESTLEDIAQTVADIEQRLQKAELAMLLSEQYDENNAIVSIHAGAGGTDAMDWAEMLMRMLMRYAESRDWEVSVLDMSNGEEAGIKSATFSVRGRRAYGYLKTESGVHRLVRISPYDAEKMRHTSFALVEVIPELSDVSDSNIDIDSNDLRIDTFMSSGPGGQGVNTTYSAVRITHTPTNTVVTCQNERSQQQNKETAMGVLKSRLYQMMIQERAEKLDELKGGHKSPEWGNQIRSYVQHPYKMVKDHRTNMEVQDVDGVLGGDLDLFIEAELRRLASNK